MYSTASMRHVVWQAEQLQKHGLRMVCSHV